MNIPRLTPRRIGETWRAYPREISKQKRTFSKYECPYCSKVFTAQIRSVDNGMCHSCGCLIKKVSSNINKKHGMTKSRIYSIWGGIKTRCYNKKWRKYCDWGGRGIKMCDDWRDNYMLFYEWAISSGYRDDLSINRIDNNGNYCPQNCNWVDDFEQSINRRIKATNTSGYNGVSYNKQTSKWIVSITHRGERRYLGLFSSAELGAEAYNNWVIEHGTKHPLNIIN